MKKQPILLSLIICLCFGLLAVSTSAQDTGGTPVTDTTFGLPQAFSAYKCTFNRNDNSAVIQAFYAGIDGRPVARTEYRLGVVQADSGIALLNRDVRNTTLEQRPPLRMVIVLDITDTVPLLEIKQALTESLIPNLLLEDEAALITFGSTISETSPFTIDKNRLINDYILGLDTQRGDNRIYDAILQGVTALENTPRDERRVVLLITDSGRRFDSQAAIDEIIARSQLAGIQIYTVSYFSRDRPDVEELRRIGFGTNGYSWAYQDEENTRSSIQRAVSDFLLNFTIALNSELQVTVAGPRPSPDTPGFARYEVSIVQGGSVYTSQIACPIEELTHEIRFATEDFNVTTAQPLDVTVAYESDLNVDAVLVRFWVDGEIVQTSPSLVYTFDTPRIQPGFHEVRAQLLDLDTNELAITQEFLSIYAQQKLDVTVTQGSFEVLQNAISLNVVAGEDINLNNVVANLYANGSDVPFRLTQGSVSEGEGSITFRNLRDRVLEFVPSAATGDVFEIRIEVPAAAPSEPPLAEPVSINFTYVAPPAPPEAAQLPWWLSALLYINRDIRILLVLVGIVLALFNMIMFIRIRRLKIKSIIGHPDDIELSDQLMTVTVRQVEGKKSFPLTKKTMTVGRGDTNDIDIGGSERISRRHGVIIWRKGRWWYSNRRSNAWAIIEGQRVRGFALVPLEAITEIEFPEGVMIFHSSAQQNIEGLFSTDSGAKPST